MKWLTIEYVKQHSRIDYDCEDGLIQLYIESAEETVLQYLGRTYDDLVENYGAVPANIIHASLLLTAISYNNREPASGQNMSAIPYGNIDLLLKPYMVL